MRIVIVGAGAVGGYYGSLLAKQHDMVFVARGEHLRAMRENGLRVVSPYLGDEWSVEQAVFTDKPDGVADLMIIAVKSHHTPYALDIAEACVGEDTNIMTVQNGVENESLIAERYGRERTISAAAYVAAEVIEPGVIEHWGNGRLTIGALNEGMDETLEKIKESFEPCGIPVRITADIMFSKWRKLAWNAAYNSITALAQCTISDIVDSEHGRELVRKAMWETVRVAEAQGYDIGSQFIERTFEGDRKLFDNSRTSTLQDAEKNKPMEYEALNGMVVRLGKEHGIDTPVNRTLYTLLKVMEKSE